MKDNSWKKFDRRHSGYCGVEIGDLKIRTTFEIGIVETGKQRVYAGFEVRVSNPAGGAWVGHDQWSLSEALRIAEAKAQVDGASLICAGLSMFWFETGLSAGSGFGYFPWSKSPVFMMDKPTGPENEPEAETRQEGDQPFE